jgi:hypothetical protein
MLGRSLLENFGYVVAEAMILGLPVVLPLGRPRDERRWRDGTKWPAGLRSFTTPLAGLLY